jgi:hypothetical protein
MKLKPKTDEPVTGHRCPRSLKPYERAARKHTRKQIGKLKASYREFGWVNPLIIDDAGMVLCGHGRLLMALELGLDLVPVVVLSHMSEAQKRAYILADNRLAQEGSWSKELLRDELRGLIDLGFDVELTGFDTLEIDTMLSFDDSEQPVDDDVHLPGGTERPVTRVGERWQIGQHRLFVGDARDPAVYELLMEGARAQLIFTDPPMAAPSPATCRGSDGSSTATSSWVQGKPPCPSSPPPSCVRLSGAWRAMPLQAQSRSCAPTGAQRRTSSMRRRACSMSLRT